MYIVDCRVIMSDCHDVNVKCRVKACMCCVGMFNIQALCDGFPKCCMLYFKCHPCVLDCKCCLFVSALHLRRCSVAWSNRPCPCWEWRMKARSMPAQNSLLPVDTHMCQRLRQCVNPLPEQMTILPNHQPSYTAPLPGTSIFFVVKQPQSTPPWDGPRHQRVCTL